MAGVDEGQDGQEPEGGDVNDGGGGDENVHVNLGIQFEVGVSAFHPVLKAMKTCAYKEPPDEEPEPPPLVRVSTDQTTQPEFDHLDRKELVRFEVPRAKQNLCDGRDLTLHGQRPLRVHKRDKLAWLYAGDHHAPNCDVPGPREVHWDIVTYRPRPTAEQIYKHNTVEDQLDPAGYLFKTPPPEEKARIVEEFWRKRLEGYAEYEKRVQQGLKVERAQPNSKPKPKSRLDTRQQQQRHVPLQGLREEPESQPQTGAYSYNSITHNLKFSTPPSESGPFNSAFNVEEMLAAVRARVGSLDPPIAPPIRGRQAPAVVARPFPRPSKANANAVGAQGQKAHAPLQGVQGRGKDVAIEPKPKIRRPIVGGTATKKEGATSASKIKVDTDETEFVTPYQKFMKELFAKLNKLKEKGKIKGPGGTAGGFRGKGG